MVSESTAGPCTLDWPNIRHPQLAASGDGESNKNDVPKHKTGVQKNSEVRPSGYGIKKECKGGAEEDSMLGMR